MRHIPNPNLIGALDALSARPAINRDLISQAVYREDNTLAQRASLEVKGRVDRLDLIHMLTRGLGLVLLRTHQA